MRRFVVACLFAALPLAVVTAQDEAPSAAKLSRDKLSRELDRAMRAQDWSTAEHKARQLTELAPDSGKGWHVLGYALHAQGKLDEALPAHVKASESSDPESAATGAYNAACVHALKGNADEAFAWLAKSREKGFAQRSQLEQDTDLKALHADPRWKELLGSFDSEGDSEGDAEAAGPQVLAYEFGRKGSRLVVFEGKVPQVAVDYGPIRWRTDFAELVNSEKTEGRRWRLGKDLWTSLSSNVPLEFGGVEVPAGIHYVVLSRSGGNYSLHLLDPQPMHAQGLDAIQAAQTTGGITIPLEHEELDVSTPELSIRIEAVRGNDPYAGNFVIDFGPHRLSAPLKLKP